MAAGEAHAQGDPGVAGLYAIFADRGVFGVNLFDGVEVGTFLFHMVSVACIRFSPVDFSAIVQRGNKVQ